MTKFLLNNSSIMNLIAFSFTNISSIKQDVNLPKQVDPSLGTPIITDLFYKDCEIVTSLSNL